MYMVSYVNSLIYWNDLIICYVLDVLV